MANLAFLPGPAVLALVVAGLFWILRGMLRRSREPGALRLKMCITLGLMLGLLIPVCLTGPSFSGAFIVPFVCVAIGIVMSLLWTPHVAGLMAGSITSAIDGGTEELIPRPLYSAARAKRMAARYPEAIAAVQAELARFPDDHEGQMLLAAIHAEDLHDLPRAEVIIQRLCNRPTATPPQVAGALTTLCDWHLKYAQDTELARQDLEAILERFPDSEMARDARQRIAHLADPSMLLGRHDRPTIPLPHGEERIGLRDAPVDCRPVEQSGVEKAGALLAHLKSHPDDNHAREELARVYADDCQRPEMAIAELEELVAMPNQQPKQVVHWLNTIADMQVRRQGNHAGAATTLQRVIDLFPNAAAAENARSRLNLLRLEERGQKKTAAVTLGEYEQRLGLKGSRAQRREER